jgi:hypothetical protein
MKKLIAAITITSLGAVSNGYVVGVLWGWFVVPLGVATISTAQAIGISATITLITHPVPSEADENSMRDDYKYYGRFAGRYVIGPWVVLGAAWIVARFT